MDCREVFNSNDVCVNPKSYRNGKQKIGDTQESKKETFQVKFLKMDAFSKVETD